MHFSSLSYKLLWGYCMLFQTSLAQTQLVGLNDTLTVKRLISDYFIGKGIGTVSNISFKGDVNAVALYTEPTGTLGISSGLMLSTGNAEQMAGPNSRPNAGANLGRYFFEDEYLKAMSSQCDGASISFDFIPACDSVCFNFVFGSDEYPEFVGKQFNDLFGFYIKEKNNLTSKPVNIATLSNGTYINVNSIHSKSNPTWYVDNTKPSSSAYNITEWDGYTRKVTTGMRVKPGVVYRMHMVIADISDCEYDSGILLEAKSFRSIPTRVKPIKKRYYFNFENNTSRLQSQDSLFILRLADSLSNLPIDSIHIIGHTDSVGNSAYNYQLSIDRANAVSRLMSSYLGCKLNSIGMGNKQPIASNKTTKGRKMNRRVELIFYTRPE